MISHSKWSHNSYVPPFTFSSEKDSHGYPMVQYLKLHSRELIEISEPGDPLKKLSRKDLDSLSVSPVDEIGKYTEPNEFFAICKNKPYYKLTHASGIYSGLRLTALAKTIYKKNIALFNALINAVPDEIYFQKTKKTFKTTRELFVNQRMAGGLTALMCACKMGELGMVETLTRAGGNLHLSIWRPHENFKKGDTSLLLAIRSKNNNIVKFLILNGAELPRVNNINKVLRLIDMIGMEQMKWIRDKTNTQIPIDDAIFFHEQFLQATLQAKKESWHKYKLFRLIFLNGYLVPPDVQNYISLIFLRIISPANSWWLNHVLPTNQKEFSLILKIYDISLPIIFLPSPCQERAVALFSAKRDSDGYPMAKYSVMTHYMSSTEIHEVNNPQEWLSAERLSYAYKSPIEKIMESTTVEAFFKLCTQYPYYNITHAHRGYSNEIDPLKYVWNLIPFTQHEPRLTALAKAVFKGNLKLVEGLIKAISNNIICPYTGKTARQLFVNQRMVGGLTAALCIENIQDQNVKIKILVKLYLAGADLTLSMWENYNLYKKGDTLLSRAINAKDNKLAKSVLSCLLNEEQDGSCPVQAISDRS